MATGPIAAADARQIRDTLPYVGAPAVVERACCPPAEQRSCCAADAKEDCCDAAPEEGCGCR
jgi:hypothetical protein